MATRLLILLTLCLGCTSTRSRDVPTDDDTGAIPVDPQAEPCGG